MEPYPKKMNGNSSGKICLACSRFTSCSCSTISPRFLVLDSKCNAVTPVCRSKSRLDLDSHGSLILDIFVIIIIVGDVLDFSSSPLIPVNIAFFFI